LQVKHSCKANTRTPATAGNKQIADAMSVAERTVDGYC